jgi:hypothetical protein
MNSNRAVVGGIEMRGATAAEDLCDDQMAFQKRVARGS